MPKRSRQTAPNIKDGSCAGLVGRVAPVLDDFNVALMPELIKNVAPTELISVEHLLGPALLDLLKHRDRDSLVPIIDEILNAKT